MYFKFKGVVIYVVSYVCNIHAWLYFIGNVDYQFPRDGYIQVIVSGGVDRVPFNITIKDDNTLERAEFFRLSIVDVSLPSGVTVGSRHSTEVVIYDDDRKCIIYMYIFVTICYLLKDTRLIVQCKTIMRDSMEHAQTGL